MPQRDDSLRYLRAPAPPGSSEPAWEEPAPFALTTHLAPHTSFIGRDEDLAVARRRVLDDRVRLLTLTGPGGVGKTRLALALALAEEIAPAFADGVVVVPLAAIRDPALVLPTIARAVGLREVEPRSLETQLIDALRRRQVLLVLDNFEHVREAGVPLAQLIVACPGITALVTSRVRLRVAEEHLFPVAPLALPTASPPGSSGAYATIAASPAVQLFLDRARSVAPGFALDRSNGETVAAICRRLDGLPLAIELAALRVRMLTPGELLARLQPILPLLTDGPGNVAERQRTMGQAIAWSYDLLSPAERTVLRRLAVFVGGHSLEAAEAVVGDIADGSAPTVAKEIAPGALGGARAGEPLLETLAALIDANLIERYEIPGASRYRMLETVREFARDHLEAGGELAAVATRHAAWYVDFVETMRRSGALSQQRGIDRLEAEQPNLRAALAWLLDQGEVMMALRLAGAAAEFWLRHGHLSEGIRWLERALAADTGSATAARANALVGLNMLLWSAAAQEAQPTEAPVDAEPVAYVRCVALLAEAEAVARAAGDAGALAYARLHQGYVALFRGELDLAAARGEEALASDLIIPQLFSGHGALWLLAEVAYARGDDAQAATRYGHLLELGRARGDLISLSNGLYGLAALAERRGEPQQALLNLAEAVALCRSYGDHLHAALCFAHAAGIAFTAGHPEAAARLLAAADAEHLAVTGTRAERHYVRHREVRVAAARATAGAASRDALRLPDGLAPEAALAEMLALADDLGANTAHARASVLTPREQDVVRLLVQGYTDKEIGAALGITRRTVVWHMSAIRRKLQASSRTAIVAIAVRDHLV